MTDDTLESLKARARAGEPQALQILRDRGYFAKQRAAKGFPLCHAQKRLWVLEQMVQDTTAYNCPMAVALQGDLDTAVLARALDALVARHESLRTAVRAVDGTARQFIADPMPLPLTHVDLRGAEDGEAAARAHIQADAGRPFDLTTAPLIRAHVLKVADDRHVLYLNIHHLVFDGWSEGVLVRDLTTLYQDFAANRPDSLPPLKSQYKDFATWQETMLSGEAGAKQAAYWREQLAGRLPVLDLPTDRPRPAVMSFEGALYRRVLPPAVHRALTNLAEENGASLFGVLTALVNVLLARYADQPDVIVGCPVAGRGHAGQEFQIGNFVNTLALRNKVVAESGFRDFLAQVRDNLQGAMKHQFYPYDTLIAGLALRRDPSRAPLTDILINLGVGGETRSHMGSLSAEPFDIGFISAKTDLVFDFYEIADGLSLRMMYAKTLFQPSTIETMVDHFVALVTDVVATPDKPIVDLARVETAEGGEVRGERTAKQPFAVEGSLADVVAARASTAPDALVYRDASTTLTYGALHHRAGQVAALLANLDVAPGTVTAQYLEDPAEALIGLIATHQLGGLWLPLDAESDAASVRTLLEEAEPPVLISRDDLAEQLPNYWGDRLDLDLEAEAIAAQAPAEPASPASDHGACVLYDTPGCGVKLSHAALLNTAADLVARCDVPDQGRVQQRANPNRSAFLLEVAVTLVCGGSLVRDGGTRADWAVVEAVRAEAVPLQAATALVLCQGEPDLKLPQGTRRFNAFSLTGAALVAAAGPHDPEWFNLGEPLAGNSLTLLKDNQPVPRGAYGEICLSGKGLATEILGPAEDNGAQLEPHPRHPEQRRLRTGFLGRLTRAGQLQVAGRIADLLNRDGERLNAVPIEAAVARHPEVTKAVVVVRVAEAGSCLTAFYAADKTISAESFETFLAEHLPAAHLPERFVKLPMHLLCPEDRIDRPRLANMVLQVETAQSKRTEPKDDLETVLLSLFHTVLKREEPGTEDSFFNFGGHSLLATQVVARLHRLFKMEVFLTDFFRAPTVVRLAAYLRANEPRPGHVDKVAATLRRIESMTPEQKQAALQARKAQQGS
ncbi:condensation domain-containing protein [Acanthopleuribacter pedis]|uniref:AMP-binding protein n=1 Tax=Acanthopleuribacter pedis TaxID=442870 RepID=A0A8J7QI50_9BACT|nr:condensation domain-containing protein [Acanthopleuribacter pedis]MBO1317346.1 AMP-binding protein [Acanthopleuribacter pedis]MBO1318653.1 AMP-binding protein [Acanthopleuribacter pedis]